MMWDKTWYELEPRERRGIIAVGLFWIGVIFALVFPSVALPVIVYVLKACLSLLIVGGFSFMIYKLTSMF